MDMRVRVDGPWLAVLLIGLGAWFLVREVFALGPWFAPATLAVLTAAAAAAWLITGRRLRWLTAAWLLGAWTAYKALDAYLTGGLPFAFFFAFLGLGFLGVYVLAVRPALWPLVPASLLLGLATLLWMISVGLTLAPYLVPVALIAYGAWLLTRRRG